MLARLVLRLYQRFVALCTIDEERGAESMLWAESWWFPDPKEETE